MSAWQDLVTASLIGTERAAVPVIPVPGSPSLDGAPADPAALVLDHAALLTAARRGGRAPGRAEPATGTAAEPETAPVVSQAAGRRLARLLGGEHAELLPEWLTMAVGRGRRVPAVLLPALLHQARRAAVAGPELQRLTAAAGGSRARWLAGLNAEWSFVLAYAPADEDAWRLGDAARRRGYLAALGARDPGTARELIAASWDAAGPGERVMFLGAIADRLSLADEPLLDGALDDRHAGVRTAAAALLAALPGSGLSARMAGRARECLWLDPGPPAARLVVSPPGECSAAMRRDGITPADAGRAALGVNRDLLLLAVIARTPVRTWTDGFGMRPAEILDLPLGSWAPVLFAGWSRAAISQRDQQWMAALTNLALTRSLPVWLGPAGPDGVSGPGTLRLLARHVDPALIAPGPAAGVAGPVGAAIRDALDTLRFRYQMLRELEDDDGAC
jgi:hypothetical protein